MEIEMKNVDWNKVLHTMWHAALLIGAAYAASTPKWGWVTVALQALAQQTPPLAFTNGPPQFIKTGAAAVLVLALLNGCAMMSAADKLQGTDLQALVRQENSQGCIKGLLNGSYLGNSGTFLVITTWGQSPPRACETLGTTIP